MNQDSKTVTETIETTKEIKEEVTEEEDMTALDPPNEEDNNINTSKTTTQKYITEYSISGGNNNQTNNQQHKIQFPKRFPQVGVLTNKELTEHKLKDFVWLEKTDGEHVNILISNGKVSFIKRSGNIKYTDVNIKSFSVLDGEKYEIKNNNQQKTKTNIYIFDAFVIENEDISKYNYIERMRKAEDFINKNKLNDIFIMKTYHKFNYSNDEEMIEEFNKIKEFVDNIDETENGFIDGVIFQLIAPGYLDGITSYKLKRTIMNTIDFKLFWDEKMKRYNLYLQGNLNELIYNRKIRPRIINDYYNIKQKGLNYDYSELPPNSLLILFDNPFKENCYYYNPISDIENNCKLSERLLKEAMRIKETDKTGELHNKIVEMALGDNGWIPLRIREDKDMPNGYKIGLSNCATMFSPPSISERYFKPQQDKDDKITVPYHEVNKLIRDYIINRSVRPLGDNENNKLRVLDLCGGRGADLLRLYSCGVVDICVVDGDYNAIVQYIDRAGKCKELFNKYSSQTNNNPPPANDSITINGIQYMLGEDNEKLIKQVENLNEFKINGKYDIILMNYAIHYLCYSHKCIKELSRLVKELLKEDGLFIVSCFDGDNILKNMKENNGKLKTKSFDNIIIKKEYDDVVIVNMALPTIDESGYREEPLVTKPFLNDVELEKIETYYPLKEIKKQKNILTKINNYENVEDYLSYINVHIYKNSFNIL